MTTEKLKLQLAELQRRYEEAAARTRIAAEISTTKASYERDVVEQRQKEDLLRHLRAKFAVEYDHQMTQPQQQPQQPQLHVHPQQPPPPPQRQLLREPQLARPPHLQQEQHLRPQARPPRLQRELEEGQRELEDEGRGGQQSLADRSPQRQLGLPSRPPTRRRNQQQPRPERSPQRQQELEQHGQMGQRRSQEERPTQRQQQQEEEQPQRKEQKQTPQPGQQEEEQPQSKEQKQTPQPGQQEEEQPQREKQKQALHSEQQRKKQQIEQQQQSEQKQSAQQRKKQQIEQQQQSEQKQSEQKQSGQQQKKQQSKEQKRTSQFGQKTQSEQPQQPSKAKQKKKKRSDAKQQQSETQQPCKRSRYRDESGYTPMKLPPVELLNPTPGPPRARRLPEVPEISKEKEALMRQYREEEPVGVGDVRKVARRHGIHKRHECIYPADKCIEACDTCRDPMNGNYTCPVCGVHVHPACGTPMCSSESDDEMPQDPESPDRRDTPMRARPDGGLVGISRPDTMTTSHVNAALQVIFNIKELADPLVKMVLPVPDAHEKRAMGSPLLTLCNVMRDMTVHRRAEWKAIATLLKAMKINGSAEDAPSTLDEMLKIIPDMITDNLKTRFIQEMTCATDGCGYRSVTSHDSASVIINVKTIEGKPLHSIQDYLNTHTETEHVTDKKCDWCGNKSIRSQQFLAELKETVIIDLKRTDICHNVTVTEALQVPLSILDKAGTITETITTTYELVLIVYHDQGHYTTDVRGEDGSWYNIDDDSITMRIADGAGLEESGGRGQISACRNAKKAAGQAMLVVYKRDPLMGDASVMMPAR